MNWSAHTNGKGERKYTIETLCVGSNTSWEGWKRTRFYMTAELRDGALAVLATIETPGWEYRPGLAKRRSSS